MGDLSRQRAVIANQQELVNQNPNNPEFQQVLTNLQANFQSEIGNNLGAPAVRGAFGQ